MEAKKVKLYLGIEFTEQYNLERFVYAMYKEVYQDDFIHFPEIPSKHLDCYVEHPYKDGDAEVRVIERIVDIINQFLKAGALKSLDYELIYIMDEKKYPEVKKR